MDYGFYADTYLGSRVPQGKFPECLARAKDALACLESRYRVAGSELERSLALCAMAEAIYDDDRTRGIQSAQIGSVNVRYREKTGHPLWRELYDRAGIYLTISRGVA
jgi:hypothetical protein